jgi:TorA maturation chaperone TorD
MIMTHIDLKMQLGNCFKLIAACFYEPDRELFIGEQVCSNLKVLLEGWASGAAKAASDMDLALANSDQDQLNIDHAALFVGPFELLAAPYGSVYLEKYRQVMGDSTMGVLKRYQDAGLSLDVKEPPDHIAIELEFMHYLCGKEAAAAAGGSSTEVQKWRDLQKEFYRSSLQWIPQFCDAIRTGTDHRFYTGLADCLARFMVSCGQFYTDKAGTAA